MYVYKPLDVHAVSSVSNDLSSVDHTDIGYILTQVIYKSFVTLVSVQYADKVRVICLTYY